MDADEGKALVSEEINRSTQFEVGSGVEVESSKEKVSKSIGPDGDCELGTKSTDLATLATDKEKEKEKEVESSVIVLNPSFENQQTEVLVTDANPLVDASSSDLRINAQESVSEPPLYDKEREAISLSEDGRSDHIETDQNNLESNEASDVSTAPESDTDSETESSISSIEEHDEENNLSGSLLVYSMAKLLFYFILFFNLAVHIPY
jgi:ABC-type Na+ efflux pump permease subunit